MKPHPQEGSSARSAGRRSRTPRRCLRLGVILGVALMVPLLLAHPASAAPLHGIHGSLTGARPVVGPPPTKVDGLATVVSNATHWLVGILATLATFYLTLGGARYMTADGDPSQVERAKSALRSAAIGYGLALMAPVILGILKTIVGVK